MTERMGRLVKLLKLTNAARKRATATGDETAEDRAWQRWAEVVAACHAEEDRINER